MAKSIKLEDIQNVTKEFYQMCSDVSIKQRELDQMLTAIEKNSEDFRRGKISRELFRYNESKMKKECAKIIKDINSCVDRGGSMIVKIGKEIETQRVTSGKKKRGSAANIKKIVQAQPAGS
jgi:hypothetical protein